MKISGYAMMLCASVSALSLASHANAQSAQPDQNDLSEVVVTGSRIVRNGNNAPTPVTVATTEQMALTTPTNIPDALNKLPAFSGSRNSGTTGASGNPNTGNYLNLRAFGTTRVLILLDGQRVPPTHFDGSVNIDTLPQMLVQRVDVVTGGASAVYGSDAVTGVVNFILDKHFVGLKGEAQGGISQQNDDASWKVGAAYGATVLDGRGHFIASAAHFQRKGIPSKFDRPYGEHAYQEAGTGTAANPFHMIDNGRISSVSFGGLILQGPNPAAGSLQAGTVPGTLPAALRNMQFLPDGSIAPFNAGTPSGNANLASGGDGGWLRGNAITASQNNNQLFARFEYEFTPDLTGFVQGTWAASRNAYHGQNLSRTVGSSNGINVYSGNAFLPASVQSALTAGNVAWFGLGRYEDEFGNAILIDALNTTEAAVVGLNGKLGTWNWETYYSYGEGRIHARQPNNIYNPNYYAAIDAVKDASGNIVCRVTLTNPSAYPGCVPMNIFGAGRPSAASIAYVLRTSEWQAISTQQDFAANISGSPFSTWAGEVQVAAGVEYRSLDLVETSNADPNQPFNKTGWDKQTDLRGPFTAATQNWTRGSLAPTAGSMKVKEANVEAILPLLNNAPFAKNLELNGAYRYTKYDRTGLGVSTGVECEDLEAGHELAPARRPALPRHPLGRHPGPLADRTVRGQERRNHWIHRPAHRLCRLHRQFQPGQPEPGAGSGPYDHRGRRVDPELPVRLQRLDRLLQDRDRQRDCLGRRQHHGRPEHLRGLGWHVAAVRAVHPAAAVQRPEPGQLPDPDPVAERQYRRDQHPRHRRRTRLPQHAAGVAGRGGPAAAVLLPAGAAAEDPADRHGHQPRRRRQHRSGFGRAAEEAADSECVLCA